MAALVGTLSNVHKSLNSNSHEGDVGVAGLTLGGGLSFFSSQHGLACDNVVNYEVVLADGSIVNANSSSHTDLFWALKGGGNQFGECHKLLIRFELIFVRHCDQVHS